MAVALVNVTVKVFVSPRPASAIAGLTTASMPVSPLTDAFTVTGLPLTFVTLRVTVCVPAMSPMAIEATFRLLGSIGVTPVQPPPGCTPQMKLSQSVKPES